MSMQEKIQRVLSVKRYPEIGKIYKHYKGGKYEVGTLGKRRGAENIEDVCKQLDSIKLNAKAKKLINELKSAFCEDLVIYKSIGYGSVHARPRPMWFDKITHEGYVKAFGEVERFELEK